MLQRAANRDNGPDGPPSRGMTVSHDQPDVLPQSFDTLIVVLSSASPPPLRVGYSRRTGTGVRKLTCSFSVIIYSLSSSQYYLPPQLHVCQDGLVTLIPSSHPSSEQTSPAQLAIEAFQLLGEAYVQSLRSLRFLKFGRALVRICLVY